MSICVCTWRLYNTSPNLASLHPIPLLSPAATATATAPAVNKRLYVCVCAVLQSHVSDDGVLVVLLASSHTMKQDLLRLDLEQARLLTCLSHSWAQQVK